jgi:hypothetical protein
MYIDCVECVGCSFELKYIFCDGCLQTMPMHYLCLSTYAYPQYQLTYAYPLMPIHLCLPMLMPTPCRRRGVPKARKNLVIIVTETGIGNG